MRALEVILSCIALAELPALASSSDLPPWASRHPRRPKAVERRKTWELDAYNPKEGCFTQLDLVFVVDSSGSIEDSNIEEVRRFLTDIVAATPVSPSHVHTALIQFSSKAIARWSLASETSTNPGLAKAEIAKLQHLGGLTDTSAALTEAYNVLFGADAEARKDVNKLVLLLTDGMSNRPPETQTAAERLRSEGVTIIIFGLGKHVYEKECRAAVGCPADEAACELVAVTDWGRLLRRYRQLLESFCVMPAQDAHCGDWSEWSACSVTCGDGVQVSTRKEITPAVDGAPTCPHCSAPKGKSCAEQGGLERRRSCPGRLCPVDAGCGDWSEWGPWSSTCGRSQRSRSRAPYNSPKPRGGGRLCQDQSPPKFQYESEQRVLDPCLLGDGGTLRDVKPHFGEGRSRHGSGSSDSREDTGTGTGAPSSESRGGPSERGGGRRSSGSPASSSDSASSRKSGNSEEAEASELSGADFDLRDALEGGLLTEPDGDSSGSAGGDENSESLPTTSKGEPAGPQDSAGDGGSSDATPREFDLADALTEGPSSGPAGAPSESHDTEAGSRGPQNTGGAGLYGKGALTKQAEYSQSTKEKEAAAEPASTVSPTEHLDQHESQESHPSGRPLTGESAPSDKSNTGEDMEGSEPRNQEFDLRDALRGGPLSETGGHSSGSAAARKVSKNLPATTDGEGTGAQGPTVKEERSDTEPHDFDLADALPEDSSSGAEGGSSPSPGTIQEPSGSESTGPPGKGVANGDARGGHTVKAEDGQPSRPQGGSSAEAQEHQSESEGGQESSGSDADVGNTARDRGRSSPKPPESDGAAQQAAATGKSGAPRPQAPPSEPDQPNGEDRKPPSLVAGGIIGGLALASATGGGIYYYVVKFRRSAV